ncbi:MAG TPA: hypothetical protein VIP77_20150 [Jiangellaceae bacterium]
MPGGTLVDQVVKELETLGTAVSGALDVHEAAAEACEARKETMEGVAAHLRSWLTTFDDAVVPHIASVSQWVGGLAHEGWTFGGAISTWRERAEGLATMTANHPLGALRHAADLAVQEVTFEIQEHGKLSTAIGHVKEWFDDVAAGSAAHITNIELIRSSSGVPTARRLAEDTQSWLAERVTEAWGVRKPLADFDMMRARPLAFPSGSPRPHHDLARAAVTVSQRVAAALHAARGLVESDVFAP